MRDVAAVVALELVSCLVWFGSCYGGQLGSFCKALGLGCVVRQVLYMGELL